jgi:hypothetical protein
MALSWMVPVAHYHAGYNTPGHLPELEYERFTTAEQAVDYLAEQINLHNGCQCTDDLSDCPDCVALGDHCPAHTDYTCENCITIAVLTSALADGDVARGYAAYNEADEQVYCVHPCTDKHKQEANALPLMLDNSMPMTDPATDPAVRDEQVRRVTELLGPLPWQPEGLIELTDGEPEGE